MAHLTPARVEHSDSRRGGDGLARIGRLMVRMWQIRGNNLQNFRGEFCEGKKQQVSALRGKRVSGSAEKQRMGHGMPDVAAVTGKRGGGRSKLLART